MSEYHDPTQYIRNGLVTRGENDTGIVVFDRDNPRSVYSLVPEVVQGAIERVSPEFFKYTEKALLRALERKEMLDERDYRLRVSFWAEYNAVQDGFKSKMNMANVTRGCCTYKYFYEVVLRTPQKLAWILFPVTDYKVALEEMHEYSLREMRKVLTMPLMKKKQVPRRGRGSKKDQMYYEEIEEVNIPLIREKMKIFALIDNRLKGAVTQSVRIEQKTQNLHHHQFAPQKDHTKNLEAPKSLSQIEKEIKELTNGDPIEIPQAIETTSKEEDGSSGDSET